MAIPAPALAEAAPSVTSSIRQRGVTVTPMRSRGVVTQPEHRHRAREVRPFLLEHDILKVKNIDTVTWEFRWDRRRYTVKPGETGYVPFPALVLRLGDPRSMEGEQVKFRTEDGTQGVIFTRWESLCTLFALYAIENFDIEALVLFAPKVEVTTMEGDPVTFPAQDPEMVAFPVPQNTAPGKENSDQRRLMDQLNSENQGMRSEIDDLRRLIDTKLGGDPRDADEPFDGDDEPDPDDHDETLAGALSGATMDSGPATRLR